MKKGCDRVRVFLTTVNCAEGILKGASNFSMGVFGKENTYFLDAPGKKQKTKTEKVTCPRARLNDSYKQLDTFRERQMVTSGSQKPWTVNYHSAIRTLKFKAPSNTSFVSSHGSLDMTKESRVQDCHSKARASISQTCTEKFSGTISV